MEFNDYCVILIEDDGSIQDELKNISEVSVRCLKEGDFSVCTISTAIRLEELNELLKGHKGNFFIIDLTSEEEVKYNISNESYHKHLFSDLISTYKDENDLSEESEEDMINKILDKGKGNISEKDKDMLKSMMNNKGKRQ